MHHETHPRRSARERIVCPCGRSAGAIKAEQERIVAIIRGLPEGEPRT